MATLPTGGDSGRVIEVTNINPSGSGSLWDACRATGPRKVVFKPATPAPMIFDLGQRDLDIEAAQSDLTIAGETNPHGVFIRNGTVSVTSGARNVKLTYLTLCPDMAGAMEGAGGFKALRIDTAREVLAQNLSLYGSSDERLTIYNNCDLIYVLDCLLGPSLYSERSGSDESHQFAANCVNRPGPGPTRIAMFNIACAYAEQRVPQVGARVQFDAGGWVVGGAKSRALEVQEPVSNLPQVNLDALTCTSEPPSQLPCFVDTGSPKPYAPGLTVPGGQAATRYAFPFSAGMSYETDAEAIFARVGANLMRSVLDVDTIEAIRSGSTALTPKGFRFGTSKMLPASPVVPPTADYVTHAELDAEVASLNLAIDANAEAIATLRAASGEHEAEIEELKARVGELEAWRAKMKGANE